MRPVVAPSLGNAPAQAEVAAEPMEGVGVAEGAAKQEGSPEERVAAPMSAEARAAALEAAVDATRVAYEADPDSEDAAIWLGRRIAYTGRFEEAIAFFTGALERHPQSYRLLRHRGHRKITVRDFDGAIADLSAAARLASEAALDRALHVGAPEGRIEWDEVEPDGAPNELGVPRSATRFNIYYHLALAHYLRSGPGDLERAAEAYDRCAEFSWRNDDMTVATANWRYLTLRRLGMPGPAKAALEPAHAGMNCVEDGDYLTLCLMHKGKIPPEEAMARAGKPGSTSHETVSYGVGMFHLLRADGAGRDEARRIFRRIVESPESAKASFAYIAAERELERLRVE